MLFDTHAHLDDRAFDTDRAALLSALPEQGLALVMNPGCSLASSRNAVALANSYDYIYAAVGSHPDAADEVNEDVLEEYRKLCKLSPKVKAIGEIGLDYHYEDIPR
jgi:TatD DNase family protein